MLKKIHNKIKSNIDVELHQKNHNWVVLKDIKLIILDRYIKVPAGFVTDFASVPKFIRPLVPFEFLYNQIVIAHDYLYSTKIVTRKEADLILREGLQLMDNYSLGSKIYSNLFYYAVRAFGGSHWNNS